MHVATKKDGDDLRTNQGEEREQNHDKYHRRLHQLRFVRCFDFVALTLQHIGSTLCIGIQQMHRMSVANEV